MIQLDGVGKSFGEFSLSIDLSIESGEIVSLLGPSGSGKTSALRLIAGFETPDTGRILVNERDVTAVRPSERRIGFVFQDYSLFPHMNVEQNVGYGMRVAGASAAEIRRKTDELLDLVDLSGFGTRDVARLSGGERQRVAIARALAVDPVVLLLDEPFSAIDEVLRRDLRREILLLQERLGITIVFVTHSRREALSVSNRVAVMRDGAIVQFGGPTDIYQTPANAFVASFVGETAGIEGSEELLRPEHLELAGDTEHPDAIAAGVIRFGEFHGPHWLYTVRTTRGELLVYSRLEYPVGASVAVRRTATPATGQSS